MSALTIVYLIEEGVLGQVIQHGASVSLVEFTLDGIEHQEYVCNTDFIIRAEVGIEEDDDIGL